MVLKRLTDIAISAFVLVILLPVFAVLALAVKIVDCGPVFYAGPRIGLGGSPFRMWKFRSMTVGADKGSSSTPDDDPRLTSIGRFMRRYKLDELPQFWNVLVGEMSLVGPRPQIAWAVEFYTPEERLWLTVRPGITDPASFRFSNEGEILRGYSDPDRAYMELIIQRRCGSLLTTFAIALSWAISQF